MVCMEWDKALDERLGRGKSARLALLKVLEETAGAIRPEDHPEWAMTEDVAAWVADHRREDPNRRELSTG